MKPIFTDARVAWHDSMHERSLSITAASMSQAESSAKQTEQRRQRIEVVFAAQGDDKEARIDILRQKLNATETRGDKFNSTNRGAKVAAMARIQRAVAGLPKLLQSFGNFLYSPNPTAADMEYSRYLLAKHVRLPAMTDQQSSKVESLIIPALLSYRDTAFGGREHWSPGRIIEFAHQYEVSFSAANWARDWSSVWERLLDACGGFDQQALDPVWVEINKERGDAANDG
ncbi:hypothetical protein AABC73_06935 [Pseudomonas sp. G.S.17]|uniref:hypothetical protein n=1 Tax=Pseudomonas sp. G.S.17 TaxID=3137451 RepID=UPI00311CA1C7